MKNWILSLPVLLITLPSIITASSGIPDTRPQTKYGALYHTTCTTASESIEADDRNHPKVDWKNIPPFLKDYLPGSENTLRLKKIGTHGLCVGEPHAINAHPTVTDIQNASRVGRRKLSILPTETIRDLESISYVDALLGTIKDAMTERSCSDLLSTRFFTVTIEGKHYQLTLLSGYVRLEPFDDDFEDRVESGQILAENDTQSYLALHLLERIGSIKLMLEHNEIRFTKHFIVGCCCLGKSQNINQALLMGTQKYRSSDLSQ